MNWSFVVLCLVIIALLGRQIYLRAKELQQRIDEFQEEQESHPMDPYAALSELHQLQESQKPPPKRKR